MKKRYERPSAYIEEFTPNEYVAACGESGKVYNFQCNAGRNDRYGTVYLETNGKQGYKQKGEETGLMESQRNIRQTNI